MAEQVFHPIKVGILGFGGLGQAASRVLAPKSEMIWVTAADRKGYAHNKAGLDADAALAAYGKGSLGYLEPYGVFSSNSIQEAIETQTEGYFLALPNLPNTFMAEVAQQFIRSGWQGVIVDAIKRTSAMKQLLRAQRRTATSRHYLHDRLWSNTRIADSSSSNCRPKLC